MGNYNQEAKHIKSITNSLIGFFEDNNIYIPKYQRKYEWTDEQWQEFIQTVFSEKDMVINNKRSYMGSLILCSSDSQSNFNVIDGQQRMVMLFIFLLFIFLKFENNTELKNNRDTDFLNFLAMFNNKINDFLKIESTNENQQLKELIQTVYQEKNNSIKSSNKYNRCFNFFRNHPDLSSIEFNRFFDCLKKCWLVIIKTDNLSEEIDIFITMNTTGLDLKYSNIIRSKILDIVNGNSELENNVNDIWDDIFRNQG